LSNTLSRNVAALRVQVSLFGLSAEPHGQSLARVEESKLESCDVVVVLRRHRKCT
jgi:hypothetical protein